MELVEISPRSLPTVSALFKRRVYKLLIKLDALILEPVGLGERTNLGSFPFQKLQLSLQQAPPVKARPSKPLKRRRWSLAVRQRQAGRPAWSNLRSSLSPSRLVKQLSSGSRPAHLSLLACVSSFLSALPVAQGFCWHEPFILHQRFSERELALALVWPGERPLPSPKQG
ncbi:unnamed protein product [Rangifer tarandus platyrhynchus]|uniref:Uncharacterized protein n=2 Tax=Rangifer tarandus platyrhynchus TaxID=3082113 RepID=A0ACB0EP87_RANTA|nr:unnamed protein product [Rangifer tarandus platyrhynchus]CAI9702078.1 unnamed protein product [Rangifer tarandus platyrhynchus]